MTITTNLNTVHTYAYHSTCATFFNCALPGRSDRRATRDQVRPGTTLYRRVRAAQGDVRAHKTVEVAGLGPAGLVEQVTTEQGLEQVIQVGDLPIQVSHCRNVGKIQGSYPKWWLV